MTSATDELRRLLDERGVEHYDGTESTLWLKDEHGYRASANELTSGRLSVHIWCDTPEHAISATLGDADATRERQGVGTCHSTSRWTNVFKCSMCGFEYDFITDPYQGPRFCPNCGRRVDE